MPEATSTWYEDEDLLLAELRKPSVRTGIPVIAGYDQLAEIARGGQGVVYAGLQRSTNRTVAIKVLIDGALASGSARRRFERESELVANLQHPNIVAVYDSGVTEDGKLYLVMEHITGKPLDEAIAATNKLGADPQARVRDILRSFIPVCEAVQYAHQRGVIHRDLKPSNIWMDAEGRSRILDFGLAKATGADGVGGMPARSVTEGLSIGGHFAGSLPWASPEQALGTPDGVDARTDIYSLGVILYQLVTGKFPYDVTGGLKTVLDRIVHAPPQPPQSVRPEVGGEVAAILQTALAKEPERRYQSAGDLASDLKRFLAGEPIMAKRDSAWYTVSKAVRRYRNVAIAAGLTLIAMAVALVISLWSLGEARQQRDVAKAEGERAQRESQRERAVSKFIEDMLSAADPSGLGKDVKVVDVLDQAANTIEGSFRDQPASEAAVRRVLASAYYALGMYDKSQAQARMGYDLAKDKLGLEDRGTVLLEMELASSLQSLQRGEEAMKLARDAVERATRLWGLDSLNTVSAQERLASILEGAGKGEEAEKLKRLVLEQYTKLSGPEANETIGAMGNLGNTLHSRGKLDEAAPLLERTIDLSKRVLGAARPATIAPMTTLAAVYKDLGQYEKGKVLSKEVWDLSVQAYGETSLVTLICASNYANSLLLLDENQAALPVIERVVEELTKQFGAESPYVLRSNSVLATIYDNLGQKQRSLEVKKRSFEAARRSMGDSAKTTIYLWNNYAQSLGSNGLHDEAISQMREAIAQADKAFDPTHSMPGSMRYNLGVVLKKAGQKEEAMAVFRVSAEQLLATLGPGSDWTQDAVKELTQLLDERGEKAEAESWRAKIKLPEAKPVETPAGR